MDESAEQTDRGRTPSAIECVLWHPRGSVPPPDLVSMLHERGIHPILRDDPYTAFAKLCVLHARAKQDGVDQPLALLMIDPAKLDGVEPLVEAAAMYAPRAIAWVYEEGKGLRAYAARPKTARSIEAEPARATPAADAPAPDAPVPTVVRTEPPAPRSAPPSLRLAGEGTLEPREEHEEAKSILTDEELAMLLAEDDKDAAP